MRLIDLDKAVVIYDEDNNAVIHTNIKNAEVKAIPIEWIEKWGRRNTCLYGTKDNVITILLREWECVLRVEKANKMLEDWEAEHDIN